MEEITTKKQALAAVKGNYRLLEYVPKKFITPELYLAAVKKGYELYNVPEELKTPEICLAAVKQNYRALKYVPEELRTPEIHKTAEIGQSEDWFADIR